jgi:hypothetical protein
MNNEYIFSLALIALVGFNIIPPIYTALLGKPNRKLALKRAFNNWVSDSIKPLTIMQVSAIILILGLVGCEIMKMQLKDNYIVYLCASGGICVYTGLIFSLVIFSVLDMIQSAKNHRDLIIDKYSKKIRLEGIWKYTQREREYFAKKESGKKEIVEISINELIAKLRAKVVR